MQNKKHKGKGPLLFTAALIISCPILMAEQAKALSTSAYGPSAGSYTGEQQYQLGLKSPLGLLPQHQQRMNSSLKQTKLSSLSSSPLGKLKVQDLESAQVELEQYKASLTTATNRLAQLEQNLNTTQDQLKTAQTQLTAVNAKISGLTIQISNQQDTVKAANAEIVRLDNLVTTDSTSLQAIDAALTAQTQVKNEALIALQVAQQNLNTATSELQAAQDTVSSKQTSYEVAQTLRVTAQANFQSAVTKVEQAGAQVDSKYAALQQAINDKNSKQNSLEVAQVNFERALTSYETKQALADAARSTYNDVVSNYTQLINNYNEVYNWYIYSEQNVNLTRTNLQTAQQEMTQAQWNYDNLLIVDPSSELPISTPGIKVDIYNQITSSNPRRDPNAYHLCKTETLTQINNNWGGGNVEGCGNDYVMLHYTGYFTPDQDITYLQNSADDGFYMELDGKAVINDWRLKGCSGSWYQVSLKKNQSYKLDAWFYEWGGGACSTLNYQSNTNWGVVPESWYTQGQPAPMIKNPVLLEYLHNTQTYYNATVLSNQQAEEDWIQAQIDQQQAAQDSLAGYYQVIDTATALNSLSAEADSAQVTSNELQAIFNSAQLEVDQATSNKDVANTEYLAAQELSSNATQDYLTANSNLEAATSNETDAHLTLTNAQANLAQVTSSKETATSNQTSAQQAVDTATSKESELTSQKQTATETKTNNEALLTSAQAVASDEDTKLTSYKDLLTSTEEEQSVISSSVSSAAETINKTQTNISSTKEQISTAEQNITELESLITELSKEDQGSAEIPEVIENLMDVNLAAVDPTELTEAQAEQLVEAALQTFETAEEGSPEYEQALDALFLAAQQDDIVVDEALAAIPGVGQAAVAIANVLNLVGNVGADISPKAREKAQNLVVTTLVVGQIAQAAALASASSGGSFRRKQ